MWKASHLHAEVHVVDVEYVNDFGDHDQPRPYLVCCDARVELTT